MVTPLIQARGLSWTPDGARRPVLPGLDLRIEPGERVLVAGPSGSGKSTLLRAIAGVLHVGVGGELGGELLLRGRPATDAPASVGLLLQDPRSARVAQTVLRDAAFGCENAGMPPARILTAVREALGAVHLAYDLGRDSAALSGGEAQRLALAGVIAARPDVLLLDEPTSMLDPIAAAAVRDAVIDAVTGTDIALVVVEHRLTGWAQVLDRLVVLDATGELVADGPLRATLQEQASALADGGVWVPGLPDPAPLEIPAELLPPVVLGDPPVRRAGASSDDDAALLAAIGLRVTHRPGLRVTGVHRRASAPTLALDGVDAVVHPGRVLALRGPSGAGKSSLVTALCGLTTPTSGRVEAGPRLARGLAARPDRWRSRDLAARIGWVPQDATATIVGATVRDSLLATVRALGRTGEAPRRQRGARVAERSGAPGGADTARAEGLAALLGLGGLLERNPYRLSGGEARRLAIASGLLHGPALLCLDEPTVGQDRHTWAAVAGLVLAARRAGAGVVVSTHDDALAAHADDTLTLARGRVVT